MTARSRLDEIVEECRNTIAGSQAICDAIAERAFRHGVEQSDNINGPGSIPFLRREWNWNVQPAPAGGCPGCANRPDNLKCVPGCGCHHHAHLDRRKGERRGLGCSSYYFWLGLSKFIDGKFYYYAPVNHNTGKSLPSSTTDRCGYFLDRRSGKDRRK